MRIWKSTKEELQSLKLQTVNHELCAKIDELDRANGDLTNPFASTNVATIFLDRDLVIRSCTPAVSQLFNIIASDRGRPRHLLSQPILMKPYDCDDCCASSQARSHMWAEPLTPAKSRNSSDSPAPTGRASRGRGRRARIRPARAPGKVRNNSPRGFPIPAAGTGRG